MRVLVPAKQKTGGSQDYPVCLHLLTIPINQSRIRKVILVLGVNILVIAAVYFCLPVIWKVKVRRQNSQPTKCEILHQQRQIFFHLPMINSIQVFILRDNQDYIHRVETQNRLHQNCLVYDIFHRGRPLPLANAWSLQHLLWHVIISKKIVERKTLMHPGCPTLDKAT